MLAAQLTRVLFKGLLSNRLPEAAQSHHVCGCLKGITPGKLIHLILCDTWINMTHNKQIYQGENEMPPPGQAQTQFVTECSMWWLFNDCCGRKKNLYSLSLPVHCI